METKNQLKKIVTIGPESTGKSTLCKELGAHYQTLWVKEYAREYLLKNGSDYSFENLYDIAKGQIAEEELTIESMLLGETNSAEQRTTNNGQLVFIDTDLYVIKVWSEFVFNKCDNRILTSIANRQYDLYLLCNTDLPWAKDELREYPDLATRDKLLCYYKDILINQQVPWAIISGNNEERLQQAIQAVDSLL